MTAPNADSRLPSAGDTITGFYDLNPNRVGQVDNYVTRASNYGDQSETWSGVDVNLSARIAQRPAAAGRHAAPDARSTDSCAIREKLPETAMLNPFCDASTPWLTQVKFVASYSVPRIDVQAQRHAAEPSRPALSATYVASNALVTPSLGRPLSGGAANATVNLIAPGSVNFDRYTQVDLRIGKSIPLGTYRASVNLDMFNALNANSVLALNNAFGGATPWLTPQSIMQGRLLKISGQFDF